MVETEKSGSSIQFICFREAETGKELVRPAETAYQKWQRIDGWIADSFARTSQEGASSQNFEKDSEVERFDRLSSLRSSATKVPNK